jgi:hypothetical protein
MDLTHYQLSASGSVVQIGFVYDDPTKATYYNNSPLINGTKTTVSSTIGQKINRVLVKNLSSTVSVDINEYDVFGSPTPAETVSDLTAQTNEMNIDLIWSASKYTSSYNIKRSTTPGGPYTSIATSVTSTTYTDTTATAGVTYYYVVTSLNSGGESSNSNEASATLQNINRIMLTITMTNGLEREYDLSMEEFNAFITWYDTKAAGSGPARYTFVNPLAKGAYVSRNSSVIFDKILTFDYDEYVPSN